MDSHWEEETTEGSSRGLSESGETEDKKEMPFFTAREFLFKRSTELMLVFWG